MVICMACERMRFVALILALGVSSSTCENMNGERTISGKIPLEQNTVKIEEACNQLELPPSSSRLETRITSKSSLGSVTNKFSTDLECPEVDTFFGTTLPVHGWQKSRQETRQSWLSTDTYSTYQQGVYSIEVDCLGSRGISGVRKYYLTCHWE